MHVKNLKSSRIVRGSSGDVDVVRVVEGSSLELVLLDLFPYFDDGIGKTDEVSLPRILLMSSSR
jgi:hypothetical protein